MLRRVYCAPYQGDVGSDDLPVVGGDGKHCDGLAKQVLLEPDALVSGYEQVIAIFDGVPDQVPSYERISQFSLCSEARVAASRSAAAGPWDGGYSPPRKRRRLQNEKSDLRRPRLADSACLIPCCAVRRGFSLIAAAMAFSHTKVAWVRASQEVREGHTGRFVPGFLISQSS